MANEEKGCKCNHDSSKAINCGGASGGIYGLAFIGALVYYFQHASVLMDFVLGFLKALVWPAIIAYKVLEFFKM